MINGYSLSECCKNTPSHNINCSYHPKNIYQRKVSICFLALSTNLNVPQFRPGNYPLTIPHSVNKINKIVDNIQHNMASLYIP